MNWPDQLHGALHIYSPAITASTIAVALAIGLLIGFERQWSHKDFGVRTFSLTALLGALTALISAPMVFIGMITTSVLALLLNVRGILKSREMEGTTSVALLVTFVLGALVGGGYMFASVSCAIVMTWLLSLKLQFKQFAGGVRVEEIRSALILGLLGFVVWPLLPNRYVDPWNLLEPREVWVAVVVVACIGFVNYILLRIYGRSGVDLTAILGGLVNSTAAAVELATTLPTIGLASQTSRAVLLTSVAMFARNAVLLWLFAHSAVKVAVLPMLSMIFVALYFVYRHRQRDGDAQELELHLSSPVSLRKVSIFGLLFLAIQVLGTAAIRWLGNNGGVLLVSIAGGAVSSASTTVAIANLVKHGSVTASQAGIATVLTAMTSTIMNLLIVRRQIKIKSVIHEIGLATMLQLATGVAVLVGQVCVTRYTAI